jgi:hypothetical protein
MTWLGGTCLSNSDRVRLHRRRRRLGKRPVLVEVSELELEFLRVRGYEATWETVAEALSAYLADQMLEAA